MVNVMKSIYSMVDGNVSEANRGSTQEKVKTRHYVLCIGLSFLLFNTLNYF